MATRKQIQEVRDFIALAENAVSLAKNKLARLNENVQEKWGEPTRVSPSERGKYAGRNVDDLMKQYRALKKSGPHKRGSSEYGKMRELAFAIFCADAARRDRLSVAEREQPQGGKGWTRRARRLQGQLIARWAGLYA